MVPRWAGLARVRATSSSKTIVKASAQRDHLPADTAHVCARIKSIVVPEFGGLNHLPDDPRTLLTFKP